MYEWHCVKRDRAAAKIPDTTSKLEIKPIPPSVTRYVCLSVSYVGVELGALSFKWARVPRETTLEQFLAPIDLCARRWSPRAERRPN